MPFWVFALLVGSIYFAGFVLSLYWMSRLDGRAGFRTTDRDDEFTDHGRGTLSLSAFWFVTWSYILCKQAMESGNSHGFNDKARVDVTRWRHFRGEEYERYFVATHTETGERLVIYRDMNSLRKPWARPEHGDHGWHEVVDGVPRFIPVSEAPDAG